MIEKVVLKKLFFKLLNKNFFVYYKIYDYGMYIYKK